jgi:Domain of unknown function DUF11
MCVDARKSKNSPTREGDEVSAAPHAASGGGRRAAACVAGLLAVGALASAGPAGAAVRGPADATPPKAAAHVRAADGPWGCDAFGYLFQSPGPAPGTIYQVNLATGAYTDYGTTADTVNAIGYNTTDNYMYGWDTTRGQLVRIGVDGTLTLEGVPSGMSAADATAGFNVGDFDASGDLWIATNGGAMDWYEIDLDQGTAAYDQVLAHGNETGLTGVTALPADWSYIGGALYGVASTATASAELVEFDPATHTDTAVGALPGLPGGATFGAAYTDPAGDLFASDNSSGAIYRVNVTTLAAQQVSQGPGAGNNDGARCRTAPIPTLELTKEATALAQPSDRFTVSIEAAGGTALTSATTPAAASAGAGVTASTSPWPVTQGATYTLTDAVAAGSPDPLAAYTPAISCQDTTTGTAVVPGGSAPSWTLPVTTTDAYQCTITNTPVPASLSLTKSASPTDVQHVGQLVHYSFEVTNTGELPLSGIAVADVQTAPASALTAAPACPSATLAPGASETCTATYTVTDADMRAGQISDTATARGTTPWSASIVSQPATATVRAQRCPPQPCCRLHHHGWLIPVD